MSEPDDGVDHGGSSCVNWPSEAEDAVTGELASRFGATLDLEFHREQTPSVGTASVTYREAATFP